MKNRCIVKSVILSVAIIGSLHMNLFAAQLDSGVQQVSWWKRTFGTLSWEDVQSVARSPKAITDSVHCHVKYRAESIDVWDSGQTTWQRGFGDCEDIAACIVDLCQKKGIDAWIQVFLPSGSLQGHAVAMGRTDGKIWIAGRTFSVVENIEDAKGNVGREMKSGKGAIRTMTLPGMIHTSVVTASDTK